MSENEALKTLEDLQRLLTHYRHISPELTEANGIAIQALEKQIPRKPRFYAHNYLCGVCGYLVGNDEFEWKRFGYCQHCGNKIDWQ